MEIIIIILLSILIVIALAALYCVLKKKDNSADRAVNDIIFKAIEGYGNLVSENMQNISISLDRRLGDMQMSTKEQLELMRITVDEKLTENLEKRLNNTFSQVNERLEAVYRGLGEMQTLATGVSDLKKVLTNVKTRGTWGEIALDRLLEQILAPEQYIRTAAIGRTQERVDFAIVMPGKEKENVLLPIDAKFPIEDYQRLVAASEKGIVFEVDEASKALARSIKASACSINEKYIKPPKTTDFAILYLPIEGLYAEIVRQTGLVEELQLKYKVVIAGPTTVAALLNSLQMGFKSVAIEKHSAEVRQLLSAFKTQFERFAVTLEKTQKKLFEATNTIESANSRVKIIRGKLHKVQALGEAQTDLLLEANPEDCGEITENDEM